MSALVTRRHGFPGQQMFVIPEPERERARRHPLLRALHVTDAGYFPRAAGHLVQRPRGAPTTLVFLCRRGRGWVRSAGGVQAVTTGDWVWLPAGEPHAYGSEGSGSWTIVWAHFAGDETASWREMLSHGGAPAPVARLPEDCLDEIGFDRVYGALEQGYALSRQVVAAAAMRSVLATVADLARLPRSARGPHERVLASIERLRRDWRKPHRLEELAVDAGMSVTYYSALFRKCTGFAPIDFIIRERMQHACRLLDTTDARIGEIAAQCGYADAYYFTRCFRRVMGASPRRYREVPKG